MGVALLLLSGVHAMDTGIKVDLVKEIPLKYKSETDLTDDGTPQLWVKQVGYVSAVRIDEKGLMELTTTGGKSYLRFANTQDREFYHDIFRVTLGGSSFFSEDGRRRLCDSPALFRLLKQVRDLNRRDHP